MRTIRRTMIAGALALPLMLGTAGLASADSYNETHVNVGPEGVSSHNTNASTGSAGQGSGSGTSFEKSHEGAGPDGATSGSVNAQTDGQGNASYQEDNAHAGPNGAGSDSTNASTGGQNQGGPVSGLIGGLGL